MYYNDTSISYLVHTDCPDWISDIGQHCLVLGRRHWQLDLSLCRHQNLNLEIPVQTSSLVLLSYFPVCLTLHSSSCPVQRHHFIVGKC